MIEETAVRLQQSDVAHGLASALLYQGMLAAQDAQGDQEGGVEMEAVDEDARRRAREQPLLLSLEGLGPERPLQRGARPPGQNAPFPGAGPHGRGRTRA